MNICSFTVAALSLLIITGRAMAGTIQFTGAITEPACVTDVAAARTDVSCARAASLRAIRLAAGSTVADLPWNLAVVTQSSTLHRRDIVITYR